MARRRVVDDETPDDPRVRSVLDEAQDFLRLVSEVEHDQREREKQDLAFQIPDPEHQWDDYAIAMRSPQTIAGQNVPARPMLCVDTIGEPIALVENNMASAHLGVLVHPLSEDATDDTAEVLQDLYRTIERTSRAQFARNWCFKRGIRAGRGCYRIDTEYDPDSTVPGDQRIVIRRVLYQDSVYFDPFAQEPDYCDGKRALVIEVMPLSKYKREYPDTQPCDFTPDQYSEYSTIAPGWFDAAEETVTVAEFFKIIETTETTTITVDGESRRVPDPSTTTRKLMWYRLNGVEVIEEQEKPGRYIPLIPYLANELIPVDGERASMGMIRPARDGVKLTNYAASQAVTMAATEPQAPWLMEEGQEEGHEKEFELAGTMPLTMVRYKRIGLSGQPGPAPQRMQVDVSRMSVSMQLLSMGQSFVQQATRTFDPALGKQPTAHRSGRALMALQDQTTEATGNYADTFRDVTMSYEAKVVLDLIPHIYDRPGRVVSVINGERKSRPVMLNAPFVPGPNGRPQALPMDTADQQSSAMAQVNDPQHPAKMFDLSKGRYGVSVTIGKSEQSRLAAGSDAISQLLQAEPGLVPLIGPEWLEFQDFPGVKSIQKILERNREHTMPWLSDPQNPQQQLAHAGQQIQLLQAQIAELTKLADKNKTQIAVTAMKEDAENSRAAADREVKLAVAELGAKVDRLALFMEERKRLGVEIQAARELRQENTQAAHDRAHEVATGAVEHARELELNAQEHAHALEQGQQAALLAPQPSDNGAGNA